MASAVSGISVALEGVSKRFGATQALNDINLSIGEGHIHALVGENGAGKSTLGKIIGGIYIPDRGEFLLDGSPVGKWDPPAALAAGIATIQQELSLVPRRSVAENVFLGIERSRMGVLSGIQRERYEELESEVGFGIPPEAEVGSLRLADQQKVEVLRALARRARMIVMDEPTSSLTKDETDRLHEIMDRLRGEGRTIVYVSHFLDDVLEVADTVTIMRDGIITRTGPSSEETKQSLIEGMLGRTFEATFPEIPPVAADAPVVLDVEDLTGEIPQDISFQVREGEIVALAGLVGSGRTEVARLIFGADAAQSGTIRLDGEEIPRLRPRTAIDKGIVMLPEDRRHLGLVMTQNVRENISLPRLRSFSQGGRVSRAEERGAVREAINRLNIVPPDPEGELQFYSGGNQQKSLFGKWTLHKPRVILLDEPTRGVDIGAKRSIYDAVAETAAGGSAVLLISSELEEVVRLSHRILLMSEGRIIGEMDSERASVSEVLRHLFDAGRSAA